MLHDVPVRQFLQLLPEEVVLPHENGGRVVLVADLVLDQTVAVPRVVYGPIRFVPLQPETAA